MRDSSDGSAILRAATGGGHDVTGWRLLLEATLFTGVGVLLLTGAGLPEAGVFSVFLGAAALSGRLQRLLDANREAIWVAGASPWVVNRATAWAIFLLFVGMGLAFAGLAIGVGADALRETFGQALAGPALHGDILSRRFAAGAGALLAHNLGALGVMAVLGFVYRGYGVLLAVGWNAAVWAVTLTALIARGVDQSSLSEPVFVLGAISAVAPHLLLELAGYVVGALGALFASRGVTRYRWGDDRLKRVLRASITLFVVGVAVLALAAVVEDRFAPWLLDRLR